MTRFARAKGSKASNERIPNEATPWCVMKQQLDDNSSMKNDRPEKTKTAKELLQEKDDPFYYDTTGNVNTDWAEIASPNASKKVAKIKNQLNNSPTSKQNKRKLQNGVTENANSAPQNSNDSPITQKKKFKEQKSETETQELSMDKIEKPAIKEKKILATSEELKKKKKKSKTIDSSEAEISGDLPNVELANETNSEVTKEKKKKKKINSTAAPIAENLPNVGLANDTNSELKKKKKKNKKIDSVAAEVNTTATESLDPKTENPEKKSSLIVSKRHKRNQKRIEKNALLAAAAANGEKTSEEKTPTSGGFDAIGNDWNSNVNFGKRQKFEKTGENDNRNGAVNGNSKEFKKPPMQQNAETWKAPKRKAPKIRDDKEHKRRKPDTSSIKCVINGMEVEIVKFEGFPVKKEDAERLKDLRQQMVMKGIPKSEIDGAMKLERRRAEKSLARVRKQVCFHCRKAGHNLSDCPELGEEESATGICFKCGSTEHTHFECKVTKKEEFRFASCFICREAGHIAKQCPDNPKGLYPQGGSCKICGDVTHLRKDCPDLTQEKEETIVTLNTIGENTLEALDEEKTKKIPIADDKKSKGKIVKF